MPSRLSLRQRRLLARGIPLRIQRAWGNRNFTSPGIGNRAQRALGTGNSAYVVFSRKPGTLGNATTFRIVVAGANTAASVATTGSFEAGNATVTFNSATNGSSVATSTVKDMARLVNTDSAARPLVFVTIPEGSDGTGVVAAVAATALAGAV